MITFYLWLIEWALRFCLEKLIFRRDIAKYRKSYCLSNTSIQNSNENNYFIFYFNSKANVKPIINIK